MTTFRIIICGKSNCQLFAEICLMADYLEKELPMFCYERIEKSSLEWPPWLRDINEKYNWKHSASPLVWKELLYKGSKPYYIGGASDFFEYCHSYYNFDYYMDPEVFAELNESVNQYQQKVKFELDYPPKMKPKKKPFTGGSPKTVFRVCIYGGVQPLAIPLISSLVDINLNAKRVSRIYVFDREFSETVKEKITKECDYIGHKLPSKIVKYVEDKEKPLKKSDMLIVLNHVPFSEKLAIGDWLYANAKLMHHLGHLLNQYTSQRMYIILANLGPACFNATVLRNTTMYNKQNIVVATSGLALDILQTVSEITTLPMSTMYCPPVWGFVGINHLVDINTTLYKYNTLEPYSRYRRVRNSTLLIGSITPEIRTLEHIMYFAEDFWEKIAIKRGNEFNDQDHLYKVEAIVSLIKLWFFDPDPEAVISLGVPCDGVDINKKLLMSTPETISRSFGLTFSGIFSQPCQLKKDRWRPASRYMLPRDRQMKLSDLEAFAKKAMYLRKDNLPAIVPYKLKYGFNFLRKRNHPIRFNV